MKRALVTGGWGFIGSHLTERLLSEGIEVYVVDNGATGRQENLKNSISNPKLKIFNIDIVSSDLNPAFRGVDAVFHLAGLADIVPSIQKPLDYCHANIMGTLRVLEAARNAKVGRLIYAASSSCYGIPDRTPTKETDAIRPEYPYALSKRLGEEAVLHWGKVYGLEVVSLRLFNVYGPRSRTSGTYGAVFGVFLAQKLANKPLTIVGDGTQTRDFIYVADVAEAFYQAARSSVRNEVFNVGAGCPVSVNRLAELIGGPSTHIPKRPGEPDVTHADITKIQTQIGWRPTVSFEEGVKKVMSHIEDWRQAPVWTPDSIAKANKDWFEYLGKEAL
ncbi:MAG: UDP-glucose 4-epimerase [Elusimicrobia bacterium]|nr:UDP-glucose 4-epimerase [Elusimicrobiota bacterium]